ncbi:unnamed protein product [Sphagnum compactum]
MTIISISKSSTPHRYNESPAAAVATTRLVAQLESSDKKPQLETQCPASSSDASCSNAAPQISSTASTTILVCPQLQQRRSAADQQQQQPVTSYSSSSSSSSTDKRFTRRRSRVISSFGAATENDGAMSQSFLKLERSLPERGAAASKSRNNIASGNLSQCNLSNYCRNSIGEAATLGLTVVAAYTKQHMVVRREDDQEEEEEAPDQGGEEEPHRTVDPPPATSETSVSTAAAILLQDQRSCAPPPPPPQTVIIEPIILLHRHGDCSGHLLVKEHAQDDNATSDTSDPAAAAAGQKHLKQEEGTQLPKSIGDQHDADKAELQIVTMENPLSFHNSEAMSEIMAMEKSPMGDAFDSDQSSKQFYSNANGNHASSTSLTLVDHELQLPADCVTSSEQSNSSGAYQAKPTTTRDLVDKIEDRMIVAFKEGGSNVNPDLQKSNELLQLRANQPVISRDYLEPSLSFPTLSLLLQPEETLNMMNRTLLLEKSKNSEEANGGHNNIFDMLITTATLEQQERESYPEENQAGTEEPSAAQEGFLDLLTSDSSRAAKDAHEKLSTIANNHNSSSSHQWTSATHVESLSLPDADVQELPSVTGPARANKDLTLSTWTTTQFNPFIAEKVTEEQLTEAAFLSSLQDCYSKGKAERCPGDLQYLCAAASSTNRTNYHAFRSKSTGRHSTTAVSAVKVAVREHAAGLTGGAHSDSEKEVKVSATNTQLNPLQLQDFCSKFSKVKLDAYCHASGDLDIMAVTTSLRRHGLSEKKLTDDNPVVTVSSEASSFRSPTTFKARQSCPHEGNKSPHSRKNSETSMITSVICMPAEAPVMTTLVKQEDVPAAAAVVALKSKKIQTSQVTPTLLDSSSAFPTGVVMTQSGLQNERIRDTRGAAQVKKANVDHVKGSFGQEHVDLGVTPVITTGRTRVQLKTGIESRATLMDALADQCQQKRPDFMKIPRFGVQTMGCCNHVSKIAPSLTTFDGMVTLTHEKSESIRDMLQLVSLPQQNLEEFHPVLAPSISILGNRSFSSSQQDRLWEEQAEAYSSGGRGTPGREDKSTAAASFLAPQSASAAAVSGEVLLRSASGSLRKGASSEATVVVLATSDTSSEKSGKRRGKKKGNPRTPLRSLLAEETEEDCEADSITRSTPGANPCVKHLVLRIRGMASKSSIPKSQHSRPQQKSTFWSSCICISPVK